MYDIVMKEKELLARLLTDLQEIKDFILGIEPSNDCCEEKADTCLLESMDKNLRNLDRAVGLVDIIKNTIKGGK